jgi:hypothetical protein
LQDMIRTVMACETSHLLFHRLQLVSSPENDELGRTRLGGRKEEGGGRSEEGGGRREEGGLFLTMVTPSSVMSYMRHAALIILTEMLSTIMTFQPDSVSVCATPTRPQVKISRSC